MGRCRISSHLVDLGLAETLAVDPCVLPPRDGDDMTQVVVPRQRAHVRRDDIHPIVPRKALGRQREIHHRTVQHQPLRSPNLPSPAHISALRYICSVSASPPPAESPINTTFSGLNPNRFVTYTHAASASCNAAGKANESLVALRKFTPSTRSEVWRQTVHESGPCGA